jgi:hypothetical protein
MSATNLPERRKAWPVCKAENLTVIYEQIE